MLPTYYLQEGSWYSFLLEVEKNSRAIVWLEGLHTFKKFNDLKVNEIFLSYQSCQLIKNY
jgi:hypothetical protein